MSAHRGAVYAANAKRSKIHARGHARLGESFTACGKEVDEKHQVPKGDRSLRCQICAKPQSAPKRTKPEPQSTEVEFSPETKMINELVAIKMALYDLIDEYRRARGVDT